MRLLGSGFVVFVLLTACSGPPTVGGTCTASDAPSCKSATEVYACVGGKWAIAPCLGSKQCTDSPAFNCDNSLAQVGTVCPPWVEGRTACQQLPPALVTCLGGTWQRTSLCSNCSVLSGAPECTMSGSGGGGGSSTGGGGGATGGGGGATGGGGGTTGGGGGTTGGGGGSSACGPGTCNGCCANGQCFSAPLNTSSNFCGTNGALCDDCAAKGQRCDTASVSCVASTVCNPTTCPNGCCANGQCFNAPINSTNDFCGTGGRSCSNCTQFGLVCTPGTFTCNPANTGGGGGATGGGGGATGGGGGTTGGGGGTTDPCQGVPVGGQCVSSSLVRYCSVPTGSGTPSVQTYQCPGGSICQATGSGASCVQTGTCRQGDARCSSTTAVQVCTSSGTWGAAQDCTPGRCVASAIGADCGPSGATTTVTHTLRYQTRNPRADLSDWDQPVAVPARNVLAVAVDGQSNWVDATTTNAQGQFTLNVAGATTVLFVAAGGNGLGPRYTVVNPGLGTGTFSPGQRASNASPWTWSKSVSSITNGGSTTITTAEGSGALNIYDLLQAVWASSIAANQGRAGNLITIYVGLGTEWSCGACFSQDDFQMSGTRFQTGIWMPGGAQDQGYWSDYTIAHELGHWQMESYGTDPNEGGTHILMCPTFPGQAWSEGYATWHAAAVRSQPRLEDKQGGGFFWFDLRSRLYFPQSSSAQTISGPGGTNLLAQIDENSVAAMLWYLTDSRQTGTEEIFNAVASQHMNTAPWPRGYTRRTWDVGQNCAKTNVVNTNQASMHLADLFDALSCGGSPAQSNRMPAATLLATCSAPTTSNNGAYYPYPTASPVCRSGFCYGCRASSACQPGNLATACGTGGVQCVQCGSGQSCVNGVCQ
jgi:hypothetical protein